MIMERNFDAILYLSKYMQEISTVQKSQKTLWKSATQDNFRYKTLQFGTCVPDRLICKVINTT